MDLKDLGIKHSYISYGEKGIADALINPSLSVAKMYKRSVGFFSSASLIVLLEGISKLVKNNGKILLIASPNLNANDVETIKKGYDIRRQIINDCFSREFEDAINELDENGLKILLELISKDYMDIKLAVTKGIGIYHDKLGIVEDLNGNTIAFYGSANASHAGYRDNYEKVRVARSWISGDVESIEDEKEEFDSLWNNTNQFVEVYDYTESAERNIIKTLNRKQSKNKDKSNIQLREYQLEAIDSWVKNGYHGFYVMATGTGKTWTAIYSTKKLVEDHPAMIVVCAPYKHLVKQWSEDINKAFPSAKTILVSSENPFWESELINSIVEQKYKKEKQIIVISTISSFYLERFMNALKKSEQEKLLIVDEAHRFTQRPDVLKTWFKYMLGLSATPFSGKSAQSGKELMEFFGGQVFNLPIEKALEDGYLVPYNYYPIFVNATAEEEEKFQYYTKLIASCYKNNVLINKDLLVKTLRNRLRIISMAEEKQENLAMFVNKLKNSDHFVVYCGDGKLFDENSGEEIKHIQAVKKILSEAEFRVSQFTAKENMAERMKLVESFNKGDISALAAIRCLDEGINIPSIKSALILSSNDDYREFIQRRGRILRVYKDKAYANIIDVLVLPSTFTKSWAVIELRRYLEYARLAINKESLLKKLEEELKYYQISMDEISSFEFDEVEAENDE